LTPKACFGFGGFEGPGTFVLATGFSAFPHKTTTKSFVQIIGNKCYTEQNARYTVA